MKRLVKKANTDYITFLEDILYHKAYYEEENIANVINENPDCVYSGVGYRAFFFDEEVLISARDEYMQANDTDVNNVNQEELATYIANKLIRVNGQYQSFAKSEKGLQFAADISYEEGIQLSIECEVTGLDLEKFCTKLKNDGVEARVLSSYFGEYKAEEEILVKFDNNNYKVHNYKTFIDSIINL